MASVGAGVGCAEIFSDEGRHAVYGGEVVFAEWARGFSPVVELSAGAAGEVFGGAGLVWRSAEAGSCDLKIGVAPGAYAKGDGKDLGGAFQIYSFVEAGLRLGERHRVGLRLAHLSNASVRSTNPGTEILGATYELSWR